MRLPAARLTLAVSFTLLLAACARCPRLNDERVTPPYAELLRRGEALPRASRLVRAEDPGMPALHVHAIEVHGRAGPDAPVLVLVPGVLATQETWRFLAPLLAEHHDLLLVDLPGTGRSDGPDPDDTPEPAYTPAWIGRHVLRAVDRWQAERGEARPIALVGHSMGSAVILRGLVDPTVRRELPALVERVSHVVLLAHPDVLVEAVDPTLESVATLSDLEAELGDALGLLDARIQEGVWTSVMHPERRALRREATRITDMLGDGRSRHVAQAMLRRWRPLDTQGRPLRAPAEALAAAESRVGRPKLLLWGAQDATLPVSLAPAVAARLHDVRLEVLADARHSVHQEQPFRCARLITAFLAESGGAPLRPVQGPAAPPGGSIPPAGLPPPAVVRHVSRSRR